MKILFRAFLAAAACGLTLPPVVHAASGPFEVAVTVDDLPAHGSLPPGMTRTGIAQAHINAFKAHGVPEAFGFVNAAKLAEGAGNAAVLDLWRAAGHPLGNHANSHMNLAHAPSLADWQADVVAGEPAVAARMAGADWHYFRFPNLAVGDDARGREALAWLAGRGYRIADVSIAFSDWSYTDPYARCVAKDDQTAIAALKAHYLDVVDRGIAHTLDASRRLYGRVIPLVLLTHVGGFSAVTLPDVLARLDAAGARYVPLSRALADPAYATPGGGSLITRAAGATGIALPAETRSALPALDLKEICK
ncbi:peptidoglycan/xylan/chitin deacetylase (PgdA/CDA1 family) [Pseudoduganella lurida]|uniref:Peptidoglycan/xylan/chitin deacetylase (PgdA/CDA1 family) n=1 Tax=Pseudoduganella lurida TaxID=1036180 RepID=A0A562RKI7_9BURK|nr:polysaccharide deacetylase family protein [Pseudoduganella lurida]TWI69521.1 peptidoglycan/xylan/chitin deacetylase (PgdA/CDA1 family) [Pseudoduganella lurida]